MLHFPGEFFSTKSIHLCPTDSNVIITYYFPCPLQNWNYNLFSNHRSWKNQFFFYSTFPSWSRKTKGILPFLLSYKGQRHRKNIIQRLGQLFCSVKEKTLSSCFHAKSFDNKKEYTGKVIPGERNSAHLLVVGSKRYKEALNNFQI